MSADERLWTEHVHPILEGRPVHIGDRLIGPGVDDGEPTEFTVASMAWDRTDYLGDGQPCGWVFLAADNEYEWPLRDCERAPVPSPSTDTAGRSTDLPDEATLAAIAAAPRGPATVTDGPFLVPGSTDTAADCLVGCYDGCPHDETDPWPFCGSTDTAGDEGPSAPSDVDFLRRMAVLTAESWGGPNPISARYERIADALEGSGSGCA